jgi:type IX secretion system PorP/SprF family membrane protein
MKITKIKILFLFLLFISINAFSQDPTFSQFYANSLYLAPSFAGVTEDYRLALNYRNQWMAIPGVFNTYSVSLDKSISKFNSGIGILATYDVAGSGDLSTTNICGVYSYDFRITDKWHVRPGVEFKFRYLGLNISKLIFGSQIPGSTPTPYPPVFNPVADIDFASSIIVYNDKIWGGITVDHLFRPHQSFYGSDSRLPIKYDVFGGIKIFQKEELIKQRYYDNLFISFNFQKQSGFYQSDLGVYYNKSIIILGIWYRGIPLISSNNYNDALIAMAGIQINNKLHIGYSYDLTVSRLRYSTAGSHEISLVYEFGIKFDNAKRRMRALPCPDF